MGSYVESELKRTVPAENFLTTVAANVDNDKLSDSDFRQFIRNSLPVVEFPRPKDNLKNCPCGREVHMRSWRVSEKSYGYRIEHQDTMMTQIWTFAGCKGGAWELETTGPNPERGGLRLKCMWNGEPFL